MTKASEGGGGNGIRKVQLLGDHWGNCIALFGRDCSMQRRHQMQIVNLDIYLLVVKHVMMQDKI